MIYKVIVIITRLDIKIAMTQRNNKLIFIGDKGGKHKKVDSGTQHSTK